MTARRLLAVAGLAVAATALGGGLTGCASHLDTVNPSDYIDHPGDGYYRVQTPYAHPSVPAVVIEPTSCVSPPSMMGAPPNSC